MSWLAEFNFNFFFKSASAWKRFTIFLAARACAGRRLVARRNADSRCAAVKRGSRRWMPLHCASLCQTNYSGDKRDINRPLTSEQRHWTEQSRSRLPSDVTLDWIETPPCSASTAVRRNYLLLRNCSDLMHKRQRRQGPSTQDSYFPNSNLNYWVSFNHPSLECWDLSLFVSMLSCSCRFECVHALYNWRCHSLLLSAYVLFS